MAVRREKRRRKPPQDHGSLIQKNLIEREKREFERKRQRRLCSALVIQKFIRGCLSRSRTKRQFRAAWDSDMNPVVGAKVLPDHPKLQRLQNQLLLFYDSHRADDQQRSVTFSQFTIQHTVPWLQSLLVPGDSRLHQMQRMLLHNSRLLSMEATSDVDTPLKFIEIFTDVKTYQECLSTSGAQSAVTQLQMFLISKGYFVHMKALIDAKLPPGIDVDHPSTFASSIVSLLFRPIRNTLQNDQPIDSRSKMLRCLCRDLFSEKFSKQISNFLLPVLVKESILPLTDLLDALLEDHGGSHLHPKLRPTVWLLYAVMSLTKLNLSSLPTPYILKYLYTLQALLPCLPSADTQQQIQDVEVDSDSEISSAHTDSEIREHCLQQFNTSDFVKSIKAAADDIATLTVLCRICYLLMTEHKLQVPSTSLLSTLACNARFLQHIWQELSLVTGTQLPLPQVITRDNPLSKEVTERIVPLLSVFSSLFGHLLQCLHDAESIQKGNDYLLSRTKVVQESLKKLEQQLGSYEHDQQDVGSSITSIWILSDNRESYMMVKDSSNMAPADKGESLPNACRNACPEAIDFVNQRNRLDAQLQLVREAEAIHVGEGDINSDELGDRVDKEMQSATDAIDEAERMIKDMLKTYKEADSGVKLKVNARILDSCTDLMKHIKELIENLQREIVSTTRGSATAKELYERRHHRWTEGLISAAKLVGVGATHLVGASDKVVQGKEKFEALISSSRKMAACTAQLVASSRVKADKESKESGLRNLQNVAASTARVVAPVLILVDEKDTRQQSLMPFSSKEPLYSALRNTCLGIIGQAFPKTRSVVREEYLFAMTSQQASESQQMKKDFDKQRAVWLHCFKATSQLVKQLFESDSQLPSCHKEHWSAPSGMKLTDLKAILPELHFLVSFEGRVQIFSQWGHSIIFNASRMIRINVRRDSLYEDACDRLRPENEPDLRKKLLVQMRNSQGLDEAGVDGGGITREFLSQLLKTAFDPNKGFFRATADGLLYPNPSAIIHPDFIKHYYFMGRILGKCLYEKLLVELPLASFFLHKILSRHSDVDIHHLASLDRTIHEKLLSLMDEGDVADLDLDFTVTVDYLGEVKVYELKPGGESILVTNSNREEYILLMADFWLNKQIRPHILNFRDGIADVIDVDLLQMFDPQELQVLISGAPVPIDVEDMRSHTNYAGVFSESHLLIRDFWKVARELTDDQMRSLLEFITSCSRPPLLGFKELYPKLCIQSADSEDHLPTASTCINLLRLPQYKDKELLKTRLLYAIKSGAGFELD